MLGLQTSTEPQGVLFSRIDGDCINACELNAWQLGRNLLQGLWEPSFGLWHSPQHCLLDGCSTVQGPSHWCVALVACEHLRSSKLRDLNRSIATLFTSIINHQQTTWSFSNLPVGVDYSLAMFMSVGELLGEIALLWSRDFWCWLQSIEPEKEEEAPLTPMETVSMISKMSKFFMK